MRTKHLALLAGGLILILLGSWTPYLAIDFGLREAIWRAPGVDALVPWLKPGLVAAALLAIVIWLARGRAPFGARLRGAALALVFAYGLIPLGMNSAVMSLALVLGLLGLVLAASGVAGLGPKSTWVTLPRGIWNRVRRRSKSTWVVGLFAAGLVVNLGVAAFVFGCRPAIIDTFDQVFQARIFLTGQLTAAAPPVPRAFEFLYMIIRDGHWYSQYPPGHPLLLAVGALLGATWLVGPVLGAALPPLLYATARTLWGERTGRAAGLLGLAAPYLHLMAGSHMSHTTCAFVLTLGTLGLTRMLRGGGLGAAILAGGGFGYALWTRPYPGLAVGVAAVLGFLLVARRSRVRPGLIPVAIAVAAAPVALLLLYNQATNGHPLVFGYNITQGPLHRLGFGVRTMNELTRDYGLFEAVKQTGYHLIGLNLFALGVAGPGLMLVPWSFLAARRHPFDRLIVLLALAPIAAFFLYPFTDFVLGPRLVFATVPFAVLLAARGLVRLRRAAPAAWFRLVPQPALVALLFVPCVPALLGAMEFNGRLMRSGHDRVARAVAGHDLSRALVLCDGAAFEQYGFSRLRPGLPADRPVFARDVHSTDLIRRFPDRPVFHLGRTSPGRTSPGRTSPGRTSPGRTSPGRTNSVRTNPDAKQPGAMQLSRHHEPCIDLFDKITARAPSVVLNQGMQTAVQTLTLGSIRNERHKLLYGFRTPARATFALDLPADAFLRFSAIVHPDAWKNGSTGIRFLVTVRAGPAGRTEQVTVYDRTVTRDNAGLGHLDQEVDLRRFGGRAIRLTVSALPLGGRDGTGDVFDISNLRIVRRGPPDSPRNLTGTGRE